ncbi:hypothetical protein DTO027I6_9934 [Penicillium roqueforti]|uniref:uncharacterized protein n=1 Tax=Penicillium roqueforti TaxID=5082 RepID=UPI00190BF522|nr:uncharacterized protein LCP9604111_3871 [Penicillium roqueforti]KAF9249771.1 hypothetical protein LCP9604111_3871 [Penicillium roqueforti]KAI1829859.1 hypothetical protein CBS147337_9366 [Penicillium roqueforti]KAI3121698.1 hypothetical protein CBS147330_7808 [Penicillium roqueforti]KAI3160881.1 hypothetical protein DTO039G3_8903 [Penicillium roqueforti]KAI3184736.1 hypothetical protein DTO027I6_9934 [Penicillium roqueforti]
MASNNQSDTDANMINGQETSSFPAVSTSSPQKRDQRSVSPEYNPKAGENRLRPAGDIINRITWDSAFERSNYVIGFVDRFEGQLEVTMGSWKKETTDEEFIPQHRVLYIRHVNGDIVWDRRRRIDKIFLSGNSAFSELAFLV